VLHYGNRIVHLDDGRVIQVQTHSVEK
jgi:ABC-type uncharacterized transport system ATPase component